jgi:ferredoxin-NADP reductase
MKGRLARTEEVAEKTAAFSFELSEPLGFVPGQTCDITLPRPKYQDAQGSSRTFSIASSPGDMPGILVATRMTGSAFKRSLFEAEPGEEVDVDGPYGSFTLHRNPQRPAVFLAGGIGITPFRSIIKDALERQLAHELTLFYSNHTSRDAAFAQELRTWAEASERFRLIATLTRPDASQPHGFTAGRFNGGSLTPHLVDRLNAVYYIAGPGGFVKGMLRVLDEIGVDPDEIRSEEFPGY